MTHFEDILADLERGGNLRRLPQESDGLIDLSSNDYLGFGGRQDLRDEFFGIYGNSLPMTSSASRLLGARQREYDSFESLLARSYGYGRQALLFNSGYHANTGIISALADTKTLIVADKLVHASIVDGIKLSGAKMIRFRHNDYAHLAKILERNASDFPRILLIAESVYSMDGDKADLRQLGDFKRRYPSIMLYIDEAHGVGALGPGGLGVAAQNELIDDVDIIVGTLGKALASEGAFAIVEPTIKQFLVNKSRSLIFSTALSPMQTAWSEFIWRKSLEADTERAHLAHLARILAEKIPGGEPSHIRPLIIGDSQRALEKSRQLGEQGYKVLAIRTPTVPPGTERLRFSLSASLSDEALGFRL